MRNPFFGCPNPWRFFYKPDRFVKALLDSKGEDDIALDEEIKRILFWLRLRWKFLYFWRLPGAAINAVKSWLLKRKLDKIAAKKKAQQDAQRAESFAKKQAAFMAENPEPK